MLAPALWSGCCPSALPVSARECHQGQGLVSAFAASCAGHKIATSWGSLPAAPTPQACVCDHFHAHLQPTAKPAAAISAAAVIPGPLD